MLRDRQALLDQLDNIAMFTTLESSELESEERLALEQNDYYEDTDTDTEMSDASRYTDSFNDNGSIGTTDTKNTDIVPILPSMKELPELPNQLNHDHHNFQKQIQIGILNVKNLGNVLDCIEDLLLQENQMIEEELVKVIHEIENSVPGNTFNVPVDNMITRRSKR
mmetsp:Transcript_815/g.914  ORF Transcript_815/g.914 Transcript_815/m.914 type:complete len:166 (+) Transcript_815:82-579(+)